MNFLVKILLFIFLFVQTAPSIISIIDKDFSIDFIEDNEKTKEEKQFMTEFVFIDYNPYVIFSLKNPTEFNTVYLMKKYIIFSSLDLLPPEQV